MAPVIRISDKTWERLKKHAEPFVHSPDDVVNIALDALENAETKSSQLGAGTSSSIAVTAVAAAQVVQSRPGKKLPQKEFRKPLLETLYDLGGRAATIDVRKVMAQKMADRLSDADHAYVSSGDPRWWNAVCWERNNLVVEGILRDDSDRGVWELSDRGLALVKARVWAMHQPYEHTPIPRLTADPARNTR